jgi:hypothetical protein
MSPPTPAIFSEDPAWAAILRNARVKVRITSPMMAQITRGGVGAGITDLASRWRGWTNGFLSDLRLAFVFLEARDVRTPEAQFYWVRQMGKGIVGQHRRGSFVI